MNSDSLEHLLATGRLERVPIDQLRSETLLQQARRHLESAAAIADADPPLAYVALYDAARKAISAHMLAQGYRELARRGAHQAVVEYARIALVDRGADAALARLDSLRRNRNRSEYESWDPQPRVVLTDLAHARSIVEAVAGELA